MKTIKSILGLFVAVGFVFLVGCNNDDEGPDALTIVSISASGNDVLSGQQVTLDLNGATSAEDVPVNATMVVTFSREVDAASVTSTSLEVTSGDAAVATSVVVSGADVTVTLSEELARGTTYSLALAETIKASDGGEFTAVSRTFKTGGVAPVTPPKVESQVAYWNFDASTADVMGNYTTANEIEIDYVTDRHGQAASTVTFDGDASLIEIANGSALCETNDLTISFWIKSNSSDKNDNDETRGQFVFGLAGWNGFQFEIFGNYGGCKLAAQYSIAEGNTSAQDLWWSTNGNLGWQGWTFDKDVSETGGLAAIMADKWVHVIVTYDATTKIGSMYMNGELVKSQDFNLYGDTHPLFGATGMAYAGNEAPGDRLALGFIQGSENRTIMDDWANPVGFPDNNHFKGEMDDFRVFHAAYSAADAKALYDAEKP